VNGLTPSTLGPALAEASGRTASAIEVAYRRLAPVYDLVYGIGLEEGRRRAMKRLAPRPGERILEVGVGTGLSACRYPPRCRVAAIDVSGPMLARARRRLARRGIHHVALCRMDGGRLAFPDARFDAVYAPYVINVVQDPLRVICEMQRVCRPGGRLVLLNHFAAGESALPMASRLAMAVAARTGGVNRHLSLDAILRDAGLRAVSVDEVNFRLSSVVVCRMP
jgi:phosphatidylethanolamine/phosphatidyl-N-methylethanolamine N-methyltransferase